MGSGESVEHAVDNTIFDVAIPKKEFPTLAKSVRDGQIRYCPGSLLMDFFLLQSFR